MRLFSMKMPGGIWKFRAGEAALGEIDVYNGGAGVRHKRLASLSIRGTESSVPKPFG